MTVSLAKSIPISDFVYTVAPTGYGYLIVKWDGLLNIERTYEVKGRLGFSRYLICDCPNRHWANNPCRHREIIAEFESLGRLGRGWFYDYDHNKWYLPISL